MKMCLKSYSQRVSRGTKDMLGYAKKLDHDTEDMFSPVSVREPVKRDITHNRRMVMMF